jgi:hypothetical protein
VGRADTVAAHCRAPYRVRRSFYHALAHALLGAPRPAGAVFEAGPRDAAPRVIVRPARVLDGLRAAPGNEYGPIDARPTPWSPEPPPHFVDRIAVLAPSAPAGPWSRDPVPLSPPALDGLLADGAWLAVQTFWVATARGDLAIARRFRLAARSRPALRARYDAAAAAMAYEWTSATGVPATVLRSRDAFGRAWRRRSVADFPGEAWLRRSADTVAPTAELRWIGSGRAAADPDGHAVVFGSSGAGKTTYLADRAAGAIARGDPVVVVDLHGDLAPAVLGRLPAEIRARVVAVDAGERPVPGIAALTGAAGDDRAAALFVAAVKRLTVDATDLYWGFRLERIFDTFVRLVQESGGSLLDLFDLLTNADRRDAARLATRRPELAHFLEELEPLVRRTPDFLWSAATRLSKVALVPALRELLAPADGGLPVESLIGEGRSVLVRIPFARLGPEAAGLAGTLVLARIFLGLAGRASSECGPRPVLLVLDEVQGFSPRLVAEILAESRKFGLRAIVATQYPERLVPEVRSAAAGASTQFVAFRIPPASAAEAGGWLGLDRLAAERLLPALATGRGVELDPESGSLRSLPPAPEVAADGSAAWKAAVDRTLGEFAPSPVLERSETNDDPVTERILLALLAAEEERRPLVATQVVAAALALPGIAPDAAAVADRWRSIQRGAWVRSSDGPCLLTPAGERWLGLGAPTLATRETGEHRRLLLRTFRVFARRGYRIEILRQGRFDTTLPDARFQQLSRRARTGVPAELASELERARNGWAWRFFSGRDVDVEAEVSGALRPERIRHGCAKAAARGAFVLFVVGDAARARRVRAVLQREGLGRDRAQVWTLAVAAGPNP